MAGESGFSLSFFTHAHTWLLIAMFHVLHTHMCPLIAMFHMLHTYMCPLIAMLTKCFPICFNGQPSKCFDDHDFGLHARRWRDLGAKIIGGCCRTTPLTIQIISSALREKS